MKKYLILLLALSCCACNKLGGPKKETWLYVIHSRNASMTPTEITLHDPDAHVLAFTDRPNRKTAMVPYREFVSSWPKAFNKLNPNATISYYDKEGKYHGDAVELINPKVSNGAVVFTIKSLDNVKIDAKRDLGETAVFIDGGDVSGLVKESRVVEMKDRPMGGANGDSAAMGSDDDMDKKCQIPSCKAKQEEPMEMDDDKECQMPTCKPKEEPEPEEEEKECTFPSCRAH